jgi:flagellar basal-body rod protein FlgF
LLIRIYPLSSDIQEIHMLKRIHIAISAMLEGINNHALKTHNTANLDTPDVKEVYTTMQESGKIEVFRPTSLEIGPYFEPIDQLGLGFFSTETKFNNGELQITNQPLDFAFLEDGLFRIMPPEGERFTRDANGMLVTIDGFSILDSSGKPILLADGEPIVDGTGSIFINRNLVVQLGISVFSNPETKLQNEDGNHFIALGSVTQSTSNTTSHQGYLEKSNVNSANLLIGTKSYQAAHIMVQNQDELFGKSISTLGKIQ